VQPKTTKGTFKVPWSLLLGVGFLGFPLPEDQGSCINLALKAHDHIPALVPEHFRGFDAVDRIHGTVPCGSFKH
jgi:hypothetical protein